MTQNMNLALGVNFDLLKTNLAAVFEKDETGSKILLVPTKIDSPTPVTLKEMIEDFKSAFGMSDEDSNKIGGTLDAVATKKEGSKFDINAITFQLQAAFLYKEMPTAAQAGTGAKAGTEAQNAPNGVTEYAFAISVDMSDALPDLGFVKLNSLFFAVWNTEREAVLRQIGTGNITKMLANLNA